MLALRRPSHPLGQALRRGQAEVQHALHEESRQEQEEEVGGHQTTAAATTCQQHAERGQVAGLCFGRAQETEVWDDAAGAFDEAPGNDEGAKEAIGTAA